MTSKRMTEPDAPLIVYKASAGSGKTFRLAVEYMKLLINNPQCYRQILAVTFTNKATEEMKSRILTHLYGIWKQLPSSKPYMDCVTKDLRITEQAASDNARLALQNLLHDHGYMRIETIDSFFQSILRNLARELELNANLRLMLNGKEAVTQAVDEMIDNLDYNSKELKWILSYIQERIDDEKSWNITSELKKFGENLLKDIYKEHAERLNEIITADNFFKEFTQQLRKLRDDALQNLSHLADPILKQAADLGLDEGSFTKGKAGPYGYFMKLAEGKYADKDLLNATVKKAADDPDMWVRKKDAVAGNAAYEFAKSTLVPALNHTEQLRKKFYGQYKSAVVTLQHLDQLRLLKSIEATMRADHLESNSFLLSNTQQLLHSLISGSDTPFIYEKIGTHIRHIMIDEFQDTSSTQWANFKVLLQECMSHADAERNRGAAANLIVGDVKQSIYRWRGGDWQVLSKMSSEFPASHVAMEDLRDNRRSARRIIEFNNVFFRHAAQQEFLDMEEIDKRLATLIKDAYSEVEQNIVNQDDNSGYVTIELLGKNAHDEDMLTRVRESIEKLLEQGNSPSDIAVLVRKNKEIQSIADYLMETHPELPLISDEAFRIDASVGVGMIIDALRHLVRPDDKIALASLARAYQQYIIKNTHDDKALFYKDDDIYRLLPAEEFIGREAQLLQLPLPDLVERIIKIFGIDTLTTETAYICSFIDTLHTFISDNTADVAAFLEEWEARLHEKSIHADSAQGIRLITIHKSKGLEFPHVIVAYCNWKLEQEDTFWCTPSEEPYSQLPIVPIDFAPKTLKGTVYEADSNQEHLNNVIDNLNLLYVAFTRAERSLHIIGNKNGNGRSKIITQVLDSITADLPGATLEGDMKNEGEAMTFTYGEPTLQTEEKNHCKGPALNVFEREEVPVEVTFHTFDGHKDFKQSNKSLDFIATDDEQQQRQYIRTGNILHKIFSTIRTRDDIAPALQQLELDGLLPGDDVDKESLIDMIEKRLQDKRVADWFSPRWQLYNERSILFIDPTDNKAVSRRPDRVMTDGSEWIVVDFKFGSPKTEYHDQVRQYMALLSSMGNENIKGYLWYVYSNRIEEVVTV